MLVPCLCFWAAIGSAAVLNIDQNFRQGDLEGLSGYTEAASIITTEAVSHGDQTSATTHKRLAERVVPEAQCGAPIDRKLIESCREAFDFLPNTGPVISFGQRVSMSQVDHVVPFLTVSSDGHCAISINITQPSIQRDEETDDHIVEALNEVFRLCILGSPPRAGTVSGLGTAQALTVTIDSTKITNELQILCFAESGGPPTEQSCTHVLDYVPYDHKTQVFGPAVNPRSSVGLPRAWRGRDPLRSRCKVALDTVVGAVIETTWAHVWTLGAIVNAVCVRRGESGAIRFVQGKAVVGLSNGLSAVADE